MVTEAGRSWESMSAAIKDGKCKIREISQVGRKISVQEKKEK